MENRKKNFVGKIMLTWKKNSHSTWKKSWKIGKKFFGKNHGK